MNRKAKPSRFFKRFIVVTVGVVLVFYLSLWTYVMVFWGWDAYLSRIPSLENYEAQKQWAVERHGRVSYASEITGCPRLYWNWPLRAYQALFKLYPDRATQDENVWASLGTCYTMLGKYDKALESYQRQMELFKAQYYKRDYPDKREIGAAKVELEEIKWIAKIHSKIADVYLKMKQLHKAIAEYDGIIKEFAPRLLKYDRQDQYDVIGTAHWEKAYIYANYSRDYRKAIELYELMPKLFPEQGIGLRSLLNIGDCHVASGDIERAKLIYQTIIRESEKPNTGYALFAKKRLERINREDLVPWYIGP